MIQRYNQKLPVCSYCLEPGHSSFKCSKKPRATLQTRSTLTTTTRLKPVGKQSKRTAAAVAKWKREYKGARVCHYCHAALIAGFYAEHMESKVRRPDLRTDPSNLVPTCGPCNEHKGSKSHDEIPHVCNL